MTDNGAEDYSNLIGQMKKSQSMLCDRLIFDRPVTSIVENYYDATKTEFNCGGKISGDKEGAPQLLQFTLITPISHSPKVQ